MTGQSIWDVLKIEATGDAGTIRRAYAARLKETNPETDGEGFKIVRAAYELALNHARYMQYREEAARREAQDVLEKDKPERDTKPEEADSDSELASLDRERPFDDDYEAPQPASYPTSAESASPAETDDLAHQQACGALVAALNSPAEPGTVLARLKDVLTGPAMNNLHTFHRTEIWLANVLMHCLPASEVLFDPLVAHFHWTPDESDWKRHAFLEPVFAWRAHLAAQNASNAFLARIRDRRHEFHRGYRMLSKPMEERNWLARTLCKRHTRTVRRLIEHVSLNVPLAEQTLNREALAWWNEYLIVRNEPIYSYARFIAYGLLVLLAVGLVGYIADEFPLDPVAQLRERSERAPQNRALAVELCRVAMLDAPSLRATDAASSTTSGTTLTADEDKLYKAIGDCGRTLLKIPESLMTHQRRAIGYLKSENWAYALEDFRAILDVSPNDPVALFGRGLALRTRGETAQGTQFMASALAVDPTVQEYLAQFKLAGVPATDVVAGTAPTMPPRPRPRADTAARIAGHASQLDMEAALQYLGIPTTLEAKVELECLVTNVGLISLCRIVEEKPFNTGMGELAIRVAGFMSAQPASLRGQPLDQAPIRITHIFHPPSETNQGKAGATAPGASNPATAPAAPNPRAAPETVSATPNRVTAPAANPPAAPAPAPLDPVATLRARSERAPQDHSLAVELCRVATLDAPRLGGTDGVASTANSDGVAGNRKKLDASIADCGRALALAPESLTARQRRAIDYLKSEKWPEALEDFRAISAVSPTDPVALFGQGLALRAQGDAAGGSELMGSALAVDPTVQEYLAQYMLAGVPATDVVAGRARIPPSYTYPKADTAAKIVHRAEQKDLDEALRYFGLRMTLTATVDMECLADKSGAVSHCLIRSEMPFNTGMGDVAIKMAESAKADPALLEGQPIDQAPVAFNYTFRLPPGK